MRSKPKVSLDSVVENISTTEVSPIGASPIVGVRQVDPNEGKGLEVSEEEDRVGEVLPGEYVIEAILDKKRKKVGNKLVPHYLVKWKGYPDSENSWVRQTRIQADELVRAFDRQNLEKKPGKVTFIDVDPYCGSIST
jgi:hypothetical protein